MKTIFKDGTYLRVSNEVGDFQTTHKEWKFVPKSEWKQKVRDHKPEEEPPTKPYKKSRNK